MNEHKAKKISSFCKIRPNSLTEHNNRCIIQSSGSSVQLVKERIGQRKFSFDYVFPSNSSQSGQTGSGKTHTIIGPPEIANIRHSKNQSDLQIQHESNFGIIPRTLQYLFKSKCNFDCKFYVSYFEIYNDKIFDLLIDDFFDQDEKLQECEDKSGMIKICNLQRALITNCNEAMTILFQGLQNRMVGATKHNHFSSRSHCIFQIEMHYTQIVQNKQDSKTTDNQQISYLRIIDLAGSEKFQIPSNISRQEENVLKNEIISINSSLSSLGNCILALKTGNRRKHVPFRDSKLTRVLSSMFTKQNNLIYLILCVSESETNVNETISTLQLGDRIQSLNKNSSAKPSIQHKALNQENCIEKRKEIIEHEIQKLKDKQSVWNKENIQQMVAQVSAPSDLNKNFTQNINQIAQKKSVQHKINKEQSTQLIKPSNNNHNIKINGNLDNQYFSFSNQDCLPVKQLEQSYNFQTYNGQNKQLEIDNNNEKIEMLMDDINQVFKQAIQTLKQQKIKNDMISHNSQ